MEKKSLLYPIICCAFCVIVVVSNIISTKMVLVPFCQNFSIPAGLLTYPLCFLLSDLATEIFGVQKAKQMVYMAFGMSLLSYSLIQIALSLPSPDPAMGQMFHSVLGLNGVILFASLTAYIASQTIDIYLYALIKQWTGSRFLWLRNNGSTLTAQLLDTAIVNVIHLHFGMGMDMSVVLPIMFFSYLYKSTFNIVLTPFFYFLVFLTKKRGFWEVLQ